MTTPTSKLTSKAPLTSSRPAQSGSKSSRKISPIARLADSIATRAKSRGKKKCHAHALILFSASVYFFSSFWSRVAIVYSRDGFGSGRCKGARFRTCCFVKLVTNSLKVSSFVAADFPKRCKTCFRGLSRTESVAPVRSLPSPSLSTRSSS